ncbi:MAG TPA: ABC transporter permease [Vicinamibacterales bacterium]|nr:ABC transporter permease [Vicinamibacterales bacterium]
MAPPPLHDRLYRALLKLFPREFRGDFGDQMADDFRDQREDAAHQPSRTPLLRLWQRTLSDALHRAPREHFDILRRDAGYALRLFRRRPGMTASALLTLAIGIGLTAAVFSVVHGVLWRSLPLPDSERLVSLEEVSPAPQREGIRVSPDNFRDWEHDTRTLDALATISSSRPRIVQEAGAEEIVGAAVSASFFRIAPARVALGRLLTPADYARVEAQLGPRDPKRPRQSPKPGVAVIGYGLWQRQFGGRPDIVGQRVSFGRLGLGDVEIVGVLEKDFRFPLVPDAECWLPDVPETGMRRARYLTAFGRLAPGKTVPEAQAEFDVIASRLEAAYPVANKGRGARVTSLREKVTGGVRTQLWLLAGSAICVLLIVCANVSNLLLTHTSGRQREFAARVALGASRAHLVRQALTEGLVLAWAGGFLGFLLARWTVPVLVTVAPVTIPRLDEVTVGLQVLAFAAAVSVVVGLVCGAVAIVGAGRTGLDSPLRSTGTSGRSAGRRFRQVLIVSEIALALMLAVAASLLVQTMRAVTALQLGFDPSNVISIGLSVDTRKLEGASAKARFESEMIAAVSSLPGVAAAGIGLRPLGSGGMGTVIRLPEDDESSVIRVDAVGPGYLEALGARLVAGRFIEDRDNASGPKVALVNEAAARQYFQGEAVGRTVLNEKDPILIVGVLGDIRNAGLEGEPLPSLYLPSAQTSTFWTNNMLVRTTGDPRELLPAIRTVVRQIDPELPLTRIQTLEERLNEEIAPRRFTLRLVSLFSLIALGLAVVGIYGVVMESVAQRVPEIGVRMALGATAGNVMTMILRQGSRLIGIGIALGIATALAMNGVMSAFVFRVPTTDPVSYASAAVALIAASLAACAVPARRAARIDPVVALRQE